MDGKIRLPELVLLLLLLPSLEAEEADDVVERAKENLARGEVFRMAVSWDPTESDLAVVLSGLGGPLILGRFSFTDFVDGLRAVRPPDGSRRD